MTFFLSFLFRLGLSFRVSLGELKVSGKDVANPVFSGRNLLPGEFWVEMARGFFRGQRGAFKSPTFQHVFFESCEVTHSFDGWVRKSIFSSFWRADTVVNPVYVGGNFFVRGFERGGAYWSRSDQALPPSFVAFVNWLVL